MREFIHDAWHGVMNADKNPLRHIPDQNARHLILQILAWMWCITFSLYFGSWFIFGITVIGHFILILAIFTTVVTFTLSKRSYSWGYHSVNRARGAVWVNGKKTELPVGDPGGEHE